VKQTLQRIENRPDGTYGFLRGADLVTLEPPWKNNKRNVSCIPPGAYTCNRTIHTESNGNQYSAWEVMRVPNRTDINIHIGNFPKDTTGCVLVGDTYGDEETAIYNSAKSFDKFMEYTGEVDEFTLVVKGVPEMELPPAKIVHKSIDYFIDQIDKVNDPKPIHVNMLKRVWAFLNGKKRIIGAGFTALGSTLIMAGVTGPVAPLCLSVGVLVGGVGIGHGIGKNSNVGKKGEFGEREWYQVLITILNFILKLFTKG